MQNLKQIEQELDAIIKPATKSPIQQAESFLAKLYDFRRNVVLDKTEYMPKGQAMYKMMTERDYNSLYCLLQKAEIRISNSTLHSILNSDYVKMYNPIVEYFDGLPEWDGTIDYMQQLANTVQTTEDTFWSDCFKRWLVAMVGGAIDDNTVNHTVIVFSGEQGLGKTTWHLNLVPEALKYYRYSGNIKPSSRDSIVHMSECILINIDELESLNKSEIGDLKEMITKSHIRLRRAYQRTVENYVRRASFCGSVNKTQFLSDTTGSRRFLCFEVKTIDNAHKIDVDMVFAQALYLYRNSFKYWFDESEIALITQKNEKYQISTMEEDLLLEHFTPADDGAFYTPTAIADIIRARTRVSMSNGFVQNIGKALQRHQFKRTKQKGVYGYLAKEIKR